MTKPRDTRLYELNTYAPTERLRDLTSYPPKVSLNLEDLKILFEEFVLGHKDAVGDLVPVSVVEFGMWLSGTGYYKDSDPCEVIW